MMLEKQMNAMQWSRKDTTYSLTTSNDCDFIVSPQDGSLRCDAPFLYDDIEGDFVLRAKVSHAFCSTYDACALFAYADDTHWAKACFEASDFQTHAVVSVMTNGISDDANGVNLKESEVWLQLARKNNTFAVHYAVDGKNYQMVRICQLPFSTALSVGILAQSPLTSGSTFTFEEVTLTNETLSDIRKGW